VTPLYKPEYGEEYGSWMMVKKPQRKKTTRSNNTAENGKEKKKIWSEW